MKFQPFFHAIVCIISLSHQSCRSVYQNVMFQNADSTQIHQSIAKLTNEYTLKEGDEVSVKIYSRKGSVLVEAIQPDFTNRQMESSTGVSTTYTVSQMGMITIPILGSIKVGGLTEPQLKGMLEQKFTKDYIDPFVVVKVENRRVFLFKGSQGAVIPLNKTPTSIFEVIAKSGGLDRFMSTSDILIIRGDVKKPKVFKVDLQTFKGIQHSETTLESNDIIYIPEKNKKLIHTMQDIGPMISIPLAVLSTVMTSIVLFVSVTK